MVCVCDVAEGTVNTPETHVQKADRNFWSPSDRCLLRRHSLPSLLLPQPAWQRSGDWTWAQGWVCGPPTLRQNPLSPLFSQTVNHRRGRNPCHRSANWLQMTPNKQTNSGLLSSLNVSWEVLEFPNRWEEIRIIFNGLEIFLKAVKCCFIPQVPVDAPALGWSPLKALWTFKTWTQSSLGEIPVAISDGKLTCFVFFPNQQLKLELPVRLSFILAVSVVFLSSSPLTSSQRRTRDGFHAWESKGNCLASLLLCSFTAAINCRWLLIGTH